jgi:Na+/proline symporter
MNTLIQMEGSIKRIILYIGTICASFAAYQDLIGFNELHSIFSTHQHRQITKANSNTDGSTSFITVVAIGNN